MTDVVRATGLTRRYGRTVALAGVDVAIGRGVTGLLGANGAGKTTLLALALGLERPDAGAIEVLGMDPVRLGPDVRARLGWSPEHHTLPEEMRAHDFVRHMGEVHGLPRRQAVVRAADVLGLVGLGEERFRPLGTMSTGQRQRVKLAQALVHDPALLLLDEPTDGLDPLQRDELLALVRRVGTGLGVDVVLSSHVLEEVERVCDDVVILHEGRVVASGGLEALRGASAAALVVELDEGAEAVAGRLEASGLTVDVAGGRLVVEGQVVEGQVAGDGAEPDEALDLVRDAVAAEGAPLRRLHRRGRTLEEVFLGASAGQPRPSDVRDDGPR